MLCLVVVRSSVCACRVCVFVGVVRAEFCNYMISTYRSVLETGRVIQQDLGPSSVVVLIQRFILAMGVGSGSFHTLRSGGFIGNEACSRGNWLAVLAILLRFGFLIVSLGWVLFFPPLLVHMWWRKVWGERSRVSRSRRSTVSASTLPMTTLPPPPFHGLHELASSDACVPVVNIMCVFRFPARCRTAV